MKTNHTKLSAMILSSLISFAISISSKAQWSGWEVIDQNFTTDASMCVAERISDLVLAKGQDNSKVYFNYLRDVIPNGWTGPQEVPGDFQTNLSPDALRTVSVDKDEVYTFATGTDGFVYYTSGTLNTSSETISWSSHWVKIDGQRTNTAPSVTFPANLSRVANNFYLFAKGDQNNKIYMNVFNGTAWKGWSAIPAFTTAAFTTFSSLESIYDYDDHAGYMKVYVFASGMNNKLFYNTFTYTALKS